jgi:hypothetical protein
MPHCYPALAGLFLPQSSSASRFTAGAFGFLTLTQCAALPARSFLIDGEAIVTNGEGLAVFDLIRHNRHGGAAVLCAFDLIELDGEDLRRSSIDDNLPLTQSHNSLWK